jgi:hypothetical protein
MRRVIFFEAGSVARRHESCEWYDSTQRNGAN